MCSFMLHEITPEVSNCISNIKPYSVPGISNIKPYSVPGMDGIPPKFIKLERCLLSPYLAKLFNKCIEQEIFPRDFKVAYVIPIPKTSSPKSFNKFPSIFLLSVFSKLF